MRAVCRTSTFGVEQRDIPVPGVTPEHVLIKISACGINPGDKAWIAGAFPEIPVSQHDVCGATASGVVVDIGEGVPREYLGRKVAVYRSLKASQDCVGAWCEMARMHYQTCVPLPDDCDEIDYAAALVSNVTAHVFLEQIVEAGHKAVVCTAGNSATGRSLLGVCHARSFPIISLVRNEAGKTALSDLGALNVLVTADADFDAQFAALSAKLATTAMFDGVGGRLLGRVAKMLPQGSTAYCYGFLAGGELVDFPSSLLLMKSLTLTSFSVLRPLVRDVETLKRILSGLQPIIGMLHFKILPGKTFRLERAAEALQWQGPGKAVLRP